MPQSTNSLGVLSYIPSISSWRRASSAAGLTKANAKNKTAAKKRKIEGTRKTKKLIGLTAGQPNLITDIIKVSFCYTTEKEEAFDMENPMVAEIAAEPYEKMQIFKDILVKNTLCGEVISQDMRCPEQNLCFVKLFILLVLVATLG